MGNYKRVCDYIQKVDYRNRDLSVSNLLGVNISKNFMPSVVDQSELDLSKYKVIQKGQFETNLSDTWKRSDDEMYCLTIRSLVNYAFTDELVERFFGAAEGQREINIYAEITLC